MLESTWDEARKDIGNIDLVIELVQRSVLPIRGKKQKNYPFDFEKKQRRKSLRGEGKIEADFLSAGVCELLLRKKTVKRVQFVQNAVGLGAKRSGNVVADLLGIDDKQSPVAGEVKVTANDPWYSVVECVEQVALIRADRKNLKAWLNTKLKPGLRATGSWGLVIAPLRYWQTERYSWIQLETKKLVDALRRKTKIRICCVEYIEGRSILNILFGLPPYCKE